MNVTFCGHSKIYKGNGIAEWLDTVLPPLIEAGASTFYLGGYGAFDGMAAAAVRRQKQTHPEIEAVLVLAYLNRERDIRGYDRSTYPPLEKVPLKFAISKRNQWMVDVSDVVISYVTHGWGGAAQTLEYAQRKKKSIINFPDAPLHPCK